jgi:UDP-hydrolysing UDP-N-acetyl-D-glucosamine 2-epimerase
VKVLVVPGSRADYGGLESTYNALIMHSVDAKFITLPTDLSTAGEHFDLAVILGDRFEILRAAVELYIQKIAICHLSGGDLTEGSADDSMRHAITKLSHLHFPTNNASAQRIIQMGEEPWRVKVVGYPGVDNLEISKFPPPWLPDDGIGNFDFILVVWHPNTLVGEDKVLDEARVLTDALDAINSHFVVVGPNSDAGGDLIRGYLKTWCNIDGNNYVDTLPRTEYLWLLKHTKCLVGNSSSGFYEAPSFGTPVVDIGDRQTGRESSGNIFKCVHINSENIRATIEQALRAKHQKVENFYHKGNASEKIAEIISKIKDPKKLLHKRFYQKNHP